MPETLAMHDWTLLSIRLDWATGHLSLLLRDHAGSTVELVAEGVSRFAVPRLREWGPSASVNMVTGPDRKDPAGPARLEVEMQTGDTIEIEAQNFVVPRSALLSSAGQAERSS